MQSDNENDDDDIHHKKSINDYAVAVDSNLSNMEYDDADKQSNNDNKNYWFYFQSRKIQNVWIKLILNCTYILVTSIYLLLFLVYL